MAKFFEQWLTRKWQSVTPETLSQFDQDVYALFSSPQGARVLGHFIDHVYSQCCPMPADALALATHNGRRSVVHELLEAYDRAANKTKYEAPKSLAVEHYDVRRAQ